MIYDQISKLTCEDKDSLDFHNSDIRGFGDKESQILDTCLFNKSQSEDKTTKGSSKDVLLPFMVTYKPDKN